MRWLAWDAEHFKPYAGAFCFEHLIKPAIGLGDPDETALVAVRLLFHRSALVLERHLAQLDFLVGDTLSIADFAAAVTLPFAAQSKLPIDDYPAIQRWHDRWMDLPAWRSPFPTWGAVLPRSSDRAREAHRERLCILSDRNGFKADSDPVVQP